MLLVEDCFKDFTTKALCDAGTHTEAILAVSADSREQVDSLVDAALLHGGRPANGPMDQDFMYGRSFHDVDGHLWEVIWMDPVALDSRCSAILAAKWHTRPVPLGRAPTHRSPVPARAGRRPHDAPESLRARGGRGSVRARRCR